MNQWALMNWAAWGLCAVFFGLLAQDFIRVELSRKREGKNLDRYEGKTRS